MRSAATTEQTAAASASVPGNALSSSRHPETPYGICTPRRANALLARRRNLEHEAPGSRRSQGRQRITADGTGARRLAFLGAVALLLVAFLALAPGASALTQRPFKETFGAASQPSFTKSTEAVAVERSSGDVLVASEGSTASVTGFGGNVSILSRFHADGTPAPFSALGTNVIDGAKANEKPCAEEPESCDATPQGEIADTGQIAIDESGGATNGDIYVTDQESDVVDIFANDGRYLGQLTGSGLHPFASVRGVAVDGSGAVYVSGEADFAYLISKYVPSANPVVNTDLVKTVEPDAIPRGLAVGSGPSASSIFLVIQNPGVEDIRQYNKDTFQIEAEFGENAGIDVAVDPVTHRVLTESGLEYETPGGGSQPVAVGRLVRREEVGSGNKHIREFAINGAGEVIIPEGEVPALALSVYGPPALVPILTTEPVSEITGTKATLAGSVNPSGVPVTECFFEYGDHGLAEHKVSCEGAIPTDSSPHPVHAKISGLDPDGHNYEFRIVAVNANGQEESEIGRFTTAQTVVTEPPSVVGSTTATLSGILRPEGAEYSECFFEYGLTTNTSFEHKVSCNPGAAGISADFAQHEVKAAITGLQSGASYRYQLVATSSILGTVIGEETTFQTLGLPRIEEVQSSGADQGSVTLEAKVDPSGFGTSYRFEWGTTTAYDHIAPIEFEPFLGAGTQSILVKTKLSGLSSGSTYHYRVVATNSQGKTESPDQVAQTLDSCGLPDGRCFEEVSRSEAGPVGDPGEANAQNEIHYQAAAGGPGGFVYPVESGYPDATRGDEVVYRGQRGPTGWESTQLSPPLLALNERPGSDSVSSYTEWLSNELSCGFVVSFQPLTSDPGMRLVREEGGGNLYRINPDGSYTGVTTLPPANKTEHIQPEYLVAGASQDCGVAVFETNISYSGVSTEPGPGGERLYEWREGTLRNGGIIPGPSGEVSVSAFAGGETSQQRDTQNAVSENGSRVFFTANRLTSPNAAEIGAQAVFVRENGAVTHDVSLSQNPSTPDTGATYQWATPDGSSVFFTANAGLTANSNTEGTDLYEYNLETKQLTDRSVTAAQGGAEVLGFVGASADGSQVYFASRNQLVAGSGNTRAQNLSAKAFSIYREKAGEISFVGTIDEADEDSVVLKLSRNWTSQVSPDGRYLLFESSAKVTNYNNDGATEAYLYDADGGAQATVCVSCLQDGLPSPKDRYGNPRYQVLTKTTAANRFHSPRFLTIHEGAPEVFFSSPDALAPGAVAGQNNIYEWSHDQVFHLVGAPEGTQIVPESAVSAVFGGASEDGSDVYLVTPETLTWEDGDGRLSVYDARVGGGFAAPATPPAPCDASVEGACGSAPVAAPGIFGPPASTSFTGAGNPAPSPAPPASAKAPPRALTRAQKLAKALTACHKDKSKSKRLSCEKQARKSYAVKAKPKAKAKAHKGGK
jgi:hypothetical protein